MKTALLALALALFAITAPAGEIRPDEAAASAGKTVTVSGLIAQVSEGRSGCVFLNFTAPYPRQPFAGYIPAWAVADLDKALALQSLAGRRVELTGNVQVYKGKPQIIITHSDQLKVVR